MSSPHTQAILLLTAHFSRSVSGEARPLSNKEWGRFALWLNSKEKKPEDLLTGSLGELLAGWVDNKVTLERIEALLNRGSALALAMEKWSRAGLWVITRSDPDYPRQLKARLGTDAPPLFFGSGNRKLLSRGGVAVVGSRNTTEADLLYSSQLGEKAAGEGLSIVSGGARGVDEAAMLGALEAEGTAVGILANELLRASTSGKYRKHLMANNLVLVSPFYPEAGFNAGNAMQRNKYIYCLSEAAIAVHSGTKGGTWEGVLENIKHAWVPVWVKPSDDQQAGNDMLVKKGALALPIEMDDFELASLVTASPQPLATPGTDMFSEAPGSASPGIEQATGSSVNEPVPTASLAADDPSQAPKKEQFGETEEEGIDSEEHSSVPDAKAPSDTDTPPGEISGPLVQTLYEHFLAILAREATASAKNVDELLEITQLHKTQLNTWIKQAVEEGKVNKLNRPVRYQWDDGAVDSAQSEMFQEEGS